MNKLEWPIGEDLIGRKVRFVRYDNGHQHWGYVPGSIYEIGYSQGRTLGPCIMENNGLLSAPPENYRGSFIFELLPEENMNKLQRIEEMEKQLAALRAEVEAEGQPKNSVEKWEPKKGSWLLSSDGTIINLSVDRHGKDFGTQRSSKKQAEKARDEMRVFNRLLAYRDEFDPEFEYDPEGWNYFIEIEACNPSLYTYDCDRTFKRSGLVYMSEQVAEELCRKLNSGEVVL